VGWGWEDVLSPFGNSVNTFLTWGVGIETDFLGAFDVYGIPIPHARKFFAKLFFKKA
jgi:hypothetical protein